MKDNVNFKFDFAISHAGEEDGLAKDFHKLLTEKGAVVFLAIYEKDKLFGKSFEEESKYKYGPETKYVIPIFSKRYPLKEWTMRELRIALKEERKREIEVILPIRLDDVNIRGIKRDRVYSDLRKDGILATVEILIHKLRENYPEQEKHVPDQWAAVFGVTIQNLFENDLLPREAPREYPFLCDWLTDDLMNCLAKVESISNVEFLEDNRDGESLSVRIHFTWNPKESPLDFEYLGWWEVLEITDLESI